jgi:hypothetical protein
VLAVIARCRPVYQRISARRLGWTVSLIAFGVVMAAAYYKQSIERELPEGTFK